jgi:hypothetical protein
MDDMATASLIYRKSAGTGVPEVQTLATLKTDLGLTGTNSGDLTLGAIGNTPNSNGASLTGQILTLQPADDTNGGVVTTVAQTFAGVKTLSSSPVISSLTTGSVPFIGAGKELAEDNTNLFWDNTNKRLSIGAGNDPTATLEVEGDVNVTATGSTTATPRTIGITNWGAGNAARYTFGDPWNALQNGYGQRMQLLGYWGVDIAGHRESATALNFVGGTASDASLNVIGTQSDDPILTVTSAAAQTGNMQEWRNSAGTVLASMDASGSIASKGATINGPINFGVDASGTDSYSISLNPAPTAYTNGFVVLFRPSINNTLAATMNVNGLGAIPILRGNSGATLSSNDISASGISMLVFYSGNFYLIR